jgi:hypothetical protein
MKANVGNKINTENIFKREEKLNIKIDNLWKDSLGGEKNQ